MPLMRFDDVHASCGQPPLCEMSNLARDAGFDVMWAVSPVWFSSAEDNRVYPKIFNAFSDVTRFYTGDRFGPVAVPDWVQVASHGLVHCDHRLLTFETQELSIVLSCSILGAKIFVPPHNKYNSDTMSVCSKHSIRLIRFSDGWRSVEHHKRDANTLWYLHHRNLTVDSFREWLG